MQTVNMIGFVLDSMKSDQLFLSNAMDASPGLHCHIVYVLMSLYESLICI